MVTWGTAFEDPQMMDDDVSPQGNNDVTSEVPPTTSETPSLAPTIEMTSQRSHDAETYAEAALGGDTACGLMCSHRAAYRTEAAPVYLPPRVHLKTSPASLLADRSLLVYQTTPLPTKCHLRPPPRPRDPTSTSCSHRYVYPDHHLT